MGKFFNIDGGFFKLMTKIADFIILDVLVLTFSLPIITIGPAITAMYYVALKAVKDEEGYLWKGFWKAFKQNFKQGFIIELIIAVACAVLYFDFSVSYNWATVQGSFGASALTFAIFGIGIIVASALIYVFPLLAKFDNTVLGTIKNSFVMSMKHLPQTIIMMIATYGLLYFTITYPMVILFTIGLVGYIDAYIFARIFDTYTKKEVKDSDEFHIKDSITDSTEDKHENQQEDK